MNLAACLWGLPSDPVAAAESVLALGYDSIDVDPGFAALTSTPHPTVTCLAAGHLFPDGIRPDAADPNARARAVARVQAALREARGLRSPVAYVAAPDPGRKARDRFRESILHLAAVAAALELRLCIEPLPGSGIPTVAGMLDFIAETGRDDLYVLLDIGHCLIAGEDLALAIDRCGDRLGYVHFDDNDGESDLHLALTNGLLSRSAIREALAAVATSPYDGPIAVEGHLNLPDPLDAMRQSLQIIRDCDPG